MTCTEEDTAIDSMIDAFRARNKMTLTQLMEVDGMFNVSLDRFTYGPNDSQDTIVPKAERRPYLHRSKAEIEMLQRIDPDWREEDDE